MVITPLRDVHAQVPAILYYGIFTVGSRKSQRNRIHKIKVAEYATSTFRDYDTFFHPEAAFTPQLSQGGWGGLGYSFYPALIRFWGERKAQPGLGRLRGHGF